VSTLVGPRFTIQRVAAASSSASTQVLKFGHPLLIKAHERVAANGHPVVGQQAVLQHRSAGTTKWRHAKGAHVKQTHRHGGVKWRTRPAANGSFRVYFRQTPEFTGVATGAHSVRVLPRFHVEPIHTASALSSSHIQGAIHPHLGGRVFLQRNVKGKWRTVKHQMLSAGHFSFQITPSSVGQLQYRLVRHNDATHGRATSRTLHIAVVHRTLSLGDSGSDVKALQNQLHRLHYDVGPRHGSYGYDTLHAVTAFEKVNGLSKDGAAGPSVWKKLSNPKRYHLRHPDKSQKIATEVNLSKQVLVLAKHGKVWRILDTSTAGGYYYTNSQGQQEKAVTPTGHFTIQYKLTGWHKSDLGELYYPSYFNNTGYAIHGEGNGNGSSEVPPYPNSHGCVRITNNAVLRYFNKLAVGTSVWIYG
jgi:peptidoglycan hydrolase-like protein with peptidoglycan-binding domain